MNTIRNNWARWLLWFAVGMACSAAFRLATSAETSDHEPRVITRTQIAQFETDKGVPIAVNLQHVSTIEKLHESQCILNLQNGQQVTINGSYDGIVRFLETRYGL